jgi:hypothetical protein
MIKTNSWKNYYHAHPDTDTCNKTLTGFGDIFAASAADKDSFHAFCLNTDMFLLGGNPNGYELQLFHQGDIIGGLRLNPNTICVTLAGHGATAQSMELQGGESFTTKMLRTPPLEMGSLQTIKLLGIHLKKLKLTKRIKRIKKIVLRFIPCRPQPFPTISF